MFSKKTLYAFLMVLLLPACASEPEGGEDNIYVQNDPSVVSAQDETASATGGAYFPPEGPANMAPYMSDDSVQVFSLDGPAPSTAPAAEPSYQGMPSSQDPNVTVYPLDNPGLPPRRSEMPAMVPPADSRQPFASPFGQGNSAAPSRSDGASAARIYFNHGEENLDSRDRQSLEQLARNLKAAPGIINVEGHASARAETSDPEDRRAVNLKSSMERAYAVSETLIQSGVPAESLRTVGLGDTQPGLLAPGMDAEGASRRVEVYVSGR